MTALRKARPLLSLHERDPGPPVPTLGHLPPPLTLLPDLHILLLDPSTLLPFFAPVSPDPALTKMKSAGYVDGYGGMRKTCTRY
ncbi:hypothetical protein EB796_002757 [Bugula neritina]|uniref:Uncharacterized protein n=1 Tax=Bugula neritina TaxID=10212 RepID=A0A7J7KLP7_BUGNE|nr:hypothetical protein EB796_002757 [Bugula neritina]